MDSPIEFLPRLYAPQPKNQTITAKMTDSDFYLTLPSNAGNNSSASSFRVQLPQTMRLSGEWECSLVELIYPYSWYNIDKSLPFVISLETENADKAIFLGELRYGHYSKVEDLLEAITRSIPRMYSNHMSIAYDKNANRVIIEVKPPATALKLPDTLLYMLGYNKAKYVKRNPGLAPHPPDMQGGLSMFYVYCDLVEHSVVGDKLAPLLRAVAVEGKFGDIINKIFVHPHYVPVLKKNFDNVEIDIKTDQNKPLALQYGKTLAKLHFRRKVNALFAV